MSSLSNALSFDYDQSQVYYPFTYNQQPHKRHRIDDIDTQPPPPQQPKPKLAACTRCKALKVKCEFKTDTDPCKRCYHTGQPCLTPGRKKRRTPPKREHLLNQIRDQATQIQKLMAQLEESSHRPRSSTNASNATDLTSPLISPSSSCAPDLADTVTNHNCVVNPDVQDWITKAKATIDTFGGYVGLGGAAMPMSLLFNEDPEDSESSDDDLDYEDAEDGVLVSQNDITDDDVGIGFALVDSDGEEAIDTNNVRKHQRTSSNHSITKKEGSPAITEKPITVPAKTFPFGLMADMLNRKKQMGMKSSEEGSDIAPDGDVGVADDDFFTASNGSDQLANKPAPYILSHGIVTPEEVEKLFKIYFDYMNLSLSLLDPVLYTAQTTYYRSSFLFTVICAIASRYYTPRPELYTQLMHHAQLTAGTTLITGRKNVEVCIAYILLSLYPVPKRRWDEDRGWIYLGLAIRVAMDINLHHPISAKPQNELHARELLNRTRVWLNCFNLDRSSGSQYGKPSVIKNTDYIANHSEGFWESSEYNILNFDIHLCCYNAELRVMADFMAQIYNNPKHPTGLNKDIDLAQLATDTDDKLVGLWEKWYATISKTDMTDPQNHFRTGLLRLAYSYGRLIALSFGFQHAFVKRHGDENPFFFRCLRAASDVVTTVVNDIGRPSQRTYLRHGPEAQSVFLTFASAFLVKLLQPKFATYLSTEKRSEIRALVQKAIDLLGSPEVAIDNRHGPKLYARFLEGLLALPMAKLDHSPGAPKNMPLPHHMKKTSRRPKSSSSQTSDHERYPETTPPLATMVPNQPHVYNKLDNGVSASATAINPAAIMMAPPLTPNFLLTPLPSHDSLSFDQFAPTLAGHDPFAMRRTMTTTGPNMSFNMMEFNNHPMGGTSSFDNHLAVPNDMGMNVDFFQPQQTYDEILQSMQALAADDWIPGVEWMGEYQGYKSPGPVYNFGQFPNPSSSC